MHCKSYSHFFSKKFQHICISLDVNFNESLTNDVVSFEQLGPDKVSGKTVKAKIKLLLQGLHCLPLHHILSCLLKVFLIPSVNVDKLNDNTDFIYTYFLSAVYFKLFAILAHCYISPCSNHHDLCVHLSIFRVIQ